MTPLEEFPFFTQPLGAAGLGASVGVFVGVFVSAVIDHLILKLLKRMKMEEVNKEKKVR